MCRKTQVALAYAHYVLSKFRDILVFWVHASTKEQFEHIYNEIANRFQIPGCENPNADKLVIVKTWLEQKRDLGWLMIFDNVDYPEIFFGDTNLNNQDNENSTIGASNRKLVNFIPRCSHGAILITTRNKHVALKFTTGTSLLDVKPLHRAESYQLITKRLNNDYVSAEQARILADHLGHLPLALAQAASFINQNSITVEKYIQHLEKSDHHLVDLLSQPLEGGGGDSSVPNAVAATWILSFEQIQNSHPFASQLLCLISFFNWQNIPHEFLVSYQEHGVISGQQEDHHEPLQLEKALGVIKAFSFISENEDSFNMHRLTQLVMRKWLAVQSKFALWQAVALRLLSRLFPDGTFETWTLCTRYLPHALSVLAFAMSDTSQDVKWKAALQIKVANLLIWLGKWDAAEHFQLSAVEIRKKGLGNEHPDTLAAMTDLAYTYNRLGRYNEAEQLAERVLKMSKKVLGQKHPDTLIAMGHLASTYRKQRRYSEAEQLGMQLLEARRKGLGQSHPDTLTAMNNLASTYRKQRRYSEAEQLGIQLLEMQQKALGQEHPDTLTTMSHLASTYRKQRRYSEAEQLGMQLLEARQKGLGQSHPDTLTTMNNLAMTWKDQGKDEKALTLMKRCLQLSERVLGINHPDTLRSRKNVDSMGSNGYKIIDYES